MVISGRFSRVSIQIDVFAVHLSVPGVSFQCFVCWMYSVRCRLSVVERRLSSTEGGLSGLRCHCWCLLLIPGWRESGGGGGGNAGWGFLVGVVFCGEHFSFWGGR